MTLTFQQFTLSRKTIGILCSLALAAMFVLLIVFLPHQPQVIVTYNGQPLSVFSPEVRNFQVKTASLMQAIPVQYFEIPVSIESKDGYGGSMVIPGILKSDDSRCPHEGSQLPGPSFSVPGTDFFICTEAKTYDTIAQKFLQWIDDHHQVWFDIH